MCVRTATSRYTKCAPGGEVGSLLAPTRLRKPPSYTFSTLLLRVGSLPVRTHHKQLCASFVCLQSFGSSRVAHPDRSYAAFHCVRTVAFRRQESGWCTPVSSLSRVTWYSQAGARPCPPAQRAAAGPPRGNGRKRPSGQAPRGGGGGKRRAKAAERRCAASARRAGGDSAMSLRRPLRVPLRRPI